MKKQQEKSSLTNVMRGSLTLYFTDRNRYQGYYLSYQGIPKDGGIGSGVTQRILPGVSEQSAENDKLAQVIFSEVEKEIETVFDRIFRREYGSES